MLVFEPNYRICAAQQFHIYFYRSISYAICALSISIHIQYRFHCKKKGIGTEHGRAITFYTLNNSHPTQHTHRIEGRKNSTFYVKSKYM